MIELLKRVKYFINSAILFKLTICILLFLILFLHYPVKPKPPMYEYKVVSFLADGHDRTGSGASKYSIIIINESDLLVLGVAGWELSSTSLEMETAYPNFGNQSYVTGIQPNVRPQRLICIFKRRVGM